MKGSNDMDYKKLSEESLDVIMQKIRDANSETFSCDEQLQSTYPKTQRRNVDMLHFHKMKEYVEEMSVGVSVGLKPSPMYAKKGIKRFIARLIEKKYLRIAELTNRDIREFNVATINALIFFRKEMLSMSNRMREQQEQIEALQKIVMKMSEAE